MSRNILYLKSTMKNRCLNIIMIFQFALIILVINANVSEVFQLKNWNQYLNSTFDKLYFFSGVVENEVELGSSEDFFELVTRLESKYPISVGYQLEEGVIIDKNENKFITCFFLNPTMASVKYKLEEGQWFQSGNDICEIIIGGKISDNYKIGEKVTMYQINYVDNKAKHKTIPSVIIGKLAFPSDIIDLGYSSNHPTFRNLFKNYDNIILTTDSSIINNSFIRYPLASLIIEEQKNIDLIDNDLLEHGQMFNLKEIEKNSMESYIQNIISKIPPNVMILIIIIFGITGITYLYNYKCMKDVSIYIICGMDRSMCRNLILFNNLVIIVFGTVLSFLLYYEKNIHKLLFRNTILGVWNFVATGFLILLFLIISLSSSQVLTRKTAINLLRRFE